MFVIPVISGLHKQIFFRFHMWSFNVWFLFQSNLFHSWFRFQRSSEIWDSIIQVSFELTEFSHVFLLLLFFSQCFPSLDTELLFNVSSFKFAHINRLQILPFNVSVFIPINSISEIRDCIFQQSLELIEFQSLFVASLHFTTMFQLVEETVFSWNSGTWSWWMLPLVVSCLYK